MMKTLTLIFAALLSVVFLKRSYRWLQWGSLALIVLGSVVISMPGSNDPWLGIFWIVLGQAFHGGLVVVEEYMMTGHSERIEPLYLMGWEGIWGFLFTSFIFILAQNTGCPLPADQCSLGRVDDFFLFLNEA